MRGHTELLWRFLFAPRPAAGNRLFAPGLFRLRPQIDDDFPARSHRPRRSGVRPEKDCRMKKVIFTLAEARSGTLYLRNLFRLNARDCACRHETFFDFGNPTMFGPAIYDAYRGHFGKIRMRLERKRSYIQKLPGETYRS